MVLNSLNKIVYHYSLYQLQILFNPCVTIIKSLQIIPTWENAHFWFRGSSKYPKPA
jgi:hypothetical protein